MTRHFAALMLALALALTSAAPLLADDPPPAKPKAVVLDDATRAKLREIAWNAAREGDVKTLTAYFEAGLPADIANDRGDTLLILAAYHRHADAVKVILDQEKTPVEARNKMGFTALTGAAYRGDLPIVKQLAEKGAKLDTANAKGQTPLMYAAMFGRTEVVKYLVEKKVDLTRKDDQGHTALDLAVQQDREGTAALLRDALKRAEEARTKEPEKARPRP
jgi:ankyrin repeat protein